MHGHLNVRFELHDVYCALNIVSMIRLTECKTSIADELFVPVSNVWHCYQPSPLTSQYIFSLALFVAGNKSLCMENSQLHNVKTRKDSNLLQLSSHVAIYQKGAHCFDIRVYNKIPSQIKNLSNNVKQFKTALNNFLQLRSFYTAFEYFNYHKN